MTLYEYCKRFLMWANSPDYWINWIEYIGLTHEEDYCLDNKLTNGVYFTHTEYIKLCEKYIKNYNGYILTKIK